MKTLPLTQGYLALVSDEDYERVKQHKWCATVHRRKDGSIRNIYAVHSVRKDNGNKSKQFLHRFVLGVTDPKEQVDHSPDHNGLNCTRGNLRLATHAENSRNSRLSVVNTSGVKGVSWEQKYQKWRAAIAIQSKDKHLGYFTSIASAKQAYDAAALKYHGAFALTNGMLEAA